jgi:outer membrane receptor protein involved in Fe transport
MRRTRNHRRGIAAAVVTTSLWAVAAVGADDPKPPGDPNVIQAVQQPPPTVLPPSGTGTQPPPTVPPPTGPQSGDASGPNPLLQQVGSPSAAPGLPPAANLGTDTSSRAEVNSVSATGTSVPLAGGQASPVLNAPDLGELLSKSVAASGVEVQRRNVISSDPRIRGYRVGQIVTMGDGAFFFPARQDLDTAVAKFDPGSVRDIIIIKGPYTTTRGPGFSFLDIATLDSPRYANGFEVHGRSAFGYSQNGDRWDGLQSVFGGGPDWGFRVTTNLLAGSDYRDGNNLPIASSYNSTNVNYALGVDLTPNAHFEFKGLRVSQHDLEYPGLYFDVDTLDTEAYSWRLTLDKQPWFDKGVFEFWYNDTVANGNTQQGAKQAFVQALLATSFNPNADQFGPNQFRDLSVTRFAEDSYGYRFATTWGDKNCWNLTAGTDLNVLGQGLIENIRFIQLQGTNPNTGLPVTVGNQPLFTQIQTVPNSQAVDPGLFYELAMPVNDRFKVRTGARVDVVYTGSGPRIIQGNIDLFGAPGSPGTTVNRTSFDPIIYSVKPFEDDLGRQFTLFNGFVSSEFKVNENVTALGAYGYGQRAPTLTELYAAGPFIGVLQQGTSRLIGDPNLDKEKLNQFDVGLKADYGDFRGGVNGFYAFINDYITFDLNKSGPGITQVVFTNTDLATLAGGEMFAQYDLTSWLTPFGNVAYVQGEDRTHSDNRRLPFLASSRRTNPLTGERAAEVEALPQIPPLELRSGFRLHEPKRNPRWQIEFSARSVMGQNNVATSLNEFTTPGFTVFDLRSYWMVNDRLLVSTGVENFGNKLYREHLDPISGNILNVDPLFRAGTNFYFAMQMTY